MELKLEEQIIQKIFDNNDLSDTNTEALTIQSRSICMFLAIKHHNHNAFNKIIQDCPPLYIGNVFKELYAANHKTYAMRVVSIIKNLNQNLLITIKSSIVKTLLADKDFSIEDLGHYGYLELFMVNAPLYDRWDIFDHILTHVSGVSLDNFIDEIIINTLEKKETVRALILLQGNYGTLLSNEVVNILLLAIKKDYSEIIDCFINDDDDEIKIELDKDDIIQVLKVAVNSQNYDLIRVILNKYVYDTYQDLDIYLDIYLDIFLLLQGCSDIVLEVLGLAPAVIPYQNVLTLFKESKIDDCQNECVNINAYNFLLQVLLEGTDVDDTYVSILNFLIKDNYNFLSSDNVKVYRAILKVIDKDNSLFENIDVSNISDSDVIKKLYLYAAQNGYKNILAELDNDENILIDVMDDVNWPNLYFRAFIKALKNGKTEVVEYIQGLNEFILDDHEIHSISIFVYEALKNGYIDTVKSVNNYSEYLTRNFIRILNISATNGNTEVFQLYLEDNLLGNIISLENAESIFKLLLNAAYNKNINYFNLLVDWLKVQYPLDQQAYHESLNYYISLAYVELALNGGIEDIDIDLSNVTNMKVLNFLLYNQLFEQSNYASQIIDDKDIKLINEFFNSEESSRLKEYITENLYSNYFKVIISFLKFCKNEKNTKTSKFPLFFSNLFSARKKTNPELNYHEEKRLRVLLDIYIDISCYYSLGIYPSTEEQEIFNLFEKELHSFITKNMETPNLKDLLNLNVSLILEDDIKLLNEAIVGLEPDDQLEVISYNIAQKIRFLPKSLRIKAYHEFLTKVNMPLNAFMEVFGYFNAEFISASEGLHTNYIDLSHIVCNILSKLTSVDIEHIVKELFDPENDDSEVPSFKETMYILFSLQGHKNHEHMLKNILTKFCLGATYSTNSFVYSLISEIVNEANREKINKEVAKNSLKIILPTIISENMHDDLNQEIKNKIDNLINTLLNRNDNFIFNSLEIQKLIVEVKNEGFSPTLRHS